MIRSSGMPRLARAVFASLALLANLVAAGVPVLHAWAHEVADSHHAPAAEMETLDHSHDEVHPGALHSDSLGVQRVAFDLAAALPVPSPELDGFLAEAERAFPPVVLRSSRAPPSPGQARAPPLVRPSAQGSHRRV